MRAVLSAVLVMLLLALAGPASADAYRGVPVGIYNVNNQVMNSGDYVYAIRFVLDRETPIYRFISGFNLEGANGLGDRSGYADGSGGTIRARLVSVKPSGEPDLSNVLAEETVGAWQRYQESKAAYNAPGLTQLLYFNMGGVRLSAGQTYAMTYQNVDATPSSNWFSENSPTVKESFAGPNGINNLDPNAPGAIANLDPREAVAWSRDGGSSWVWGRRAGEGDTPGAYAGSTSSDDGTRLPWYGWQESAASAPESNQPYYAYEERGSYTLRVEASSAASLTTAGAYAPVGADAGVLTVRNVSTGESAQTRPLGSGLVQGELDHPVTVAAGQTYEISNSGTVLKAEGDSFIETTFGIGRGEWSFSTLGNGSDRAQLFALGGEAAGTTVHHAEKPTRIVVRKALLADPAKRKRVSRLVFVGRARGARVKPGARVTVQLRVRGHWRRVDQTRLRRNGVFRVLRRARLPHARGPVRARALVRGVGHSRAVHVAVRR